PWPASGSIAMCCVRAVMAMTRLSPADVEAHAGSAFAVGECGTDADRGARRDHPAVADRDRLPVAEMPDAHAELVGAAYPRVRRDHAHGRRQRTNDVDAPVVHAQALVE